MKSRDRKRQRGHQYMITSFVFLCLLTFQSACGKKNQNGSAESSETQFVVAQGAFELERRFDIHRVEFRISSFSGNGSLLLDGRVWRDGTCIAFAQPVIPSSQDLSSDPRTRPIMWDLSSARPCESTQQTDSLPVVRYTQSRLFDSTFGSIDLSPFYLDRIPISANFGAHLLHFFVRQSEIEDPPVGLIVNVTKMQISGILVLSSIFRPDVHGRRHVMPQPGHTLQGHPMPTGSEEDRVAVEERRRFLDIYHSVKRLIVRDPRLREQMLQRGYQVAFESEVVRRFWDQTNN